MYKNIVIICRYICESGLWWCKLLEEPNVFKKHSQFGET